MSKQKEYSVSLISAGELIDNLHYGPYAREWREFEYKKVFSIGVSKNPDWNYAGEGYKSFFIHDYDHSRSLFFQEFDND
uniref:Uncharacterized protein n=1 Tax=Rhizophagus irregularis (strain DAOM 181602 / DAOM 197198 / MUCL 43194) TaxID=747089 RepID=U9SYE2_RHIID